MSFVLFCFVFPQTGLEHHQIQVSAENFKFAVESYPKIISLEVQQNLDVSKVFC